MKAATAACLKAEMEHDTFIRAAFKFSPKLTFTVDLHAADLKLIDAAATESDLRREDVLVLGAMRYAREILSSPSKYPKADRQPRFGPITASDADIVILRPSANPCKPGEIAMYLLALPTGESALYWPADQRIPDSVEMDVLDPHVYAEIDRLNIIILPRTLMVLLPQHPSEIDINEAAQMILHAVYIIEVELGRGV